MIIVSDNDIGSIVVYTGNRGWNGPDEYGVITGYNRSYVFVRYYGKRNSQATSYEDLLWEHENELSSR